MSSRVNGVALFALCLSAAVQAADTSSEETSIQARAGYSAGYEFGNQLVRLQSGQPGIDLQEVFRGITDALSGTQPKLSKDDMQAALKELEQLEIARSYNENRRQRDAHARNRGYIDDFAALNAKRDGVISLPSGVQYEVQKPGAGRQPGMTDAVLVKYQASLTNGAVFDTTYEDKEPARLQLSEIAVPGLKEALLLMNEGAKWRVVIPPSMGFKRSGNNMLRKRDLIYDIELIRVEAAATAGAQPASETQQAETENAVQP